MPQLPLFLSLIVLWLIELVIKISISHRDLLIRSIATLNRLNSSVWMKSRWLWHDLLDLFTFWWIIKVVRSDSKLFPTLWGRLSSFLSVRVLILYSNLITISAIIYNNSTTTSVLMIALKAWLFVKTIFEVTSVMSCVLLVLLDSVRVTLILAYYIQSFIATCIKILESFPEIHKFLPINSTRLLFILSHLKVEFLF